MNKGVKVRYAEQPFNFRNETFDKGTLLVTRTGNTAYNNNLERIVRETAETVGISFTPVVADLWTKVLMLDPIA